MINQYNNCFHLHATAEPKVISCRLSERGAGKGRLSHKIGTARLTRRCATTTRRQARTRICMPSEAGHTCRKATPIRPYQLRSRSLEVPDSISAAWPSRSCCSSSLACGELHNQAARHTTFIHQTDGSSNSIDSVRSCIAGTNLLSKVQWQLVYT